MANIVHAIRSPYRMERLNAFNAQLEIRVADYQIIVCHDKKCPGTDKEGHLLGEGDRSHHHDFRFQSDARDEAEIIAEVHALEEREAADANPVVLKV